MAEFWKDDFISYSCFVYRFNCADCFFIHLNINLIIGGRTNLTDLVKGFEWFIFSRDVNNNIVRSIVSAHTFHTRTILFAHNSKVRKSINCKEKNSIPIESRENADRSLDGDTFGAANFLCVPFERWTSWFLEHKKSETCERLESEQIFARYIQ